MQCDFSIPSSFVKRLQRWNHAFMFKFVSKSLFTPDQEESWRVKQWHKATCNWHVAGQASHKETRWASIQCFSFQQFSSLVHGGPSADSCLCPSAAFPSVPESSNCSCRLHLMFFGFALYINSRKNRTIIFFFGKIPSQCLTLLPDMPLITSRSCDGRYPLKSLLLPSYWEVKLMHIWHFLFPLLHMPPSGNHTHIHPYIHTKSHTQGHLLILLNICAHSKLFYNSNEPNKQSNR